MAVNMLVLAGIGLGVIVVIAAGIILALNHR